MSDVHDVVGIGLGPFNLGFAALADGLDRSLDAVFLEQKSEFNWHEGMLIEETTLEVPFLADMVTMANPTNRHSYLNYLRENDRIYEFYFYQKFYLPRREYNDYCRWVAERVPGTRFDQRVTSVREADGVFEITAVDPETGEESLYHAHDVVMGIGTRPNVPERLSGHPSSDVFHTASYLDRRERCLDADSITVVGSGQSAAEVVRDLLERQPNNDFRLDWITRSRGFTQTVDAKLGNMTYNPDYTEYFYGLDREIKDKLFPAQDLLYQGIDKPTSDRIYDILYERSIGDSDPDVGMLASTSIQDIEVVESGENPLYRLQCEHWQEQTVFEHETEVVVLGTGYFRPKPAFLNPLDDEIETDDEGRFRITENYRMETNDVSGRIFVQHADFHTHGINATDLGMGCYRNAVIINSLVGEEVYPAGRASVFQDYTVSDFLTDREST